ncbi:MAG: radical SAM protein [Planctomycetota bacterium]|nr:radical SAM protein [Planctomycetota bacterium]
MHPGVGLETPRIGEGLSEVVLPPSYDYAGIYLMQRCHLACEYCITEHNDSRFLSSPAGSERLSVDQWVAGLDRLRLNDGIPVTFQGGEPFLYKGILEIVDRIQHPVDILTALPPGVTADRFRAMRRPEALRRNAPYPNIRVSYHPGQNRIEDLIERVLEIQEVVSIGIYIVDHPDNTAERERARLLCEKAGVFFKTKEFLGYHEGVLYGEYRYPGATVGRVVRPEVWCRNTVLIVHSNGTIFHCHSDLYHRREDLAVGHILDHDLSIPDRHRICQFYGLCSECDVKVKTNHHQVFGYTSADIRFENPE